MHLVGSFIALRLPHVRSVVISHQRGKLSFKVRFGDIHLTVAVVGSSCSKEKYCLLQKVGRHDYKRKYWIERTLREPRGNEPQTTYGEGRELTEKICGHRR